MDAILDSTYKGLDYAENAFNEISIKDVQKEYSLSDVKEPDDKSIDYSKVSSVTEYIPQLPYTGESILGKIATQVDNLLSGGNGEKTYNVAADNPIDLLMSQEPDFMPNMYNIYFILMDRDTQQVSSNSQEAFKTANIVDIDMTKSIERVDYDSGRNYLNTEFTKRWSMIGTRIDGIDIPQYKQTVQQIRYAGQVINKVVGKRERATRVDLNVRLDQSMFILDAFHALDSDFWASERKRLDGGKEFYTGKQFYNLLGLAAQDSNFKRKALDIVVEYDADYFTFSRYHDKVGTIGYGANSLSLDASSVPQPDARWMSKKDRVQRYVFHDCKFLGRSSALQFKSSGAEAMTATFPFTFRKIAHMTANGNV